MNGGIEIEGLNEFRRALRACDKAMPRQLTAALKAAGKPPLAETKQFAAATTHSIRSTGALATGYKLSTSGASASIKNAVPYAAGAEWGLGGKWSGFRIRYRGIEPGPKGRFAWRAVYEQRDEIQRIMTQELEQLLEVQGWARP